MVLNLDAFHWSYLQAEVTKHLDDKETCGYLSSHFKLAYWELCSDLESPCPSNDCVRNCFENYKDLETERINKAFTMIALPYPLINPKSYYIIRVDAAIYVADK